MALHTLNRRGFIGCLAATTALGAAALAEMNTDNLSGKARIRIRRPPSDVFTAFADASAMSKFWFTRRDDGLIVIEWENGGEHTRVAWSIEGTAEGDTILTIEESGFTGSRQSIIERALDSTGGFNQVTVAAKALVEHGVELNVVADHA